MPALRLALLLAAAMPLAAQAQIAHADFDGPTFQNNAIPPGGPGLSVAIRTVVPNAAVASRVEVWTGERLGANTIALWSHDAIANRPLAPLGSGSWSMTRVNGWQGAPLNTPVSLAAGQTVWVVWGCQYGSQSSVAGAGAGAQPYCLSYNGGPWGSVAQSWQWKLRIWSGPAGHYELYGQGCQGSAGTPELGFSGMPAAGASLQLTLERAVPGTFALLSFGDSDTQSGGTPLPFSLATLGAPGCSVLGSLLVTVLHPTDPVSGAAVVPVTLPPDPTLAGFRFYDQWFCLDPAGNALGLTASNAGVATIGA